MFIKFLPKFLLKYLPKYFAGVLKFVTLLFVIFSLSSCLHYVHVTSNTFADEKSIPCGFRYGSTFFVKAARANDPLFSKEVAYKIEKILTNLGYNVVADVNNADYCLVFNFEMLSSKQTRDVLKYEPGETSVKKGYSCANGHESGHECRHKCEYGSCGHECGHECKNNCSSKHELVEYEEEISTPGKFFYVKENYIEFKKELFIEVYDAKLYKDTKKQEQLWSGYSYKCGENSDLRAAMDYLLISAFKFFGHSTKRNVNLSMGEKEVREERLRLGL